MRERRARIAAGATVIGLGALGAAALGSNHGMPLTRQASGTSASVVTSASGTALPVSQATTKAGETARAPIVTRASGAPGGTVVDD